MIRFVLRRLAQSLVVVLLVTSAAFVIIHLAPGSPLTQESDVTRRNERYEAMQRKHWGLDRPLPEQLVRYIANVARGDLGTSYAQHRPVASLLAEALPNTLALVGSALVLSFGVGMLTGLVQARRRGRPTDRALSAVSLFFYSMPDFWLAIGMVLIFGVHLGWFPTSGMIKVAEYPYYDTWQRALDRLHHAVLPVLCLTLLSAAAIARHQRSAALEVIGQDYVRTARAKGVSERRVVLRHVLRNALLPVITLVGLAFPALVGGSVLIEAVFGWPGMGLLVTESIGKRDYTVVTACVIVGSVMVALGSLLADLLYAAADPRLRRA